MADIVTGLQLNGLNVISKCKVALYRTSTHSEVVRWTVTGLDLTIDILFLCYHLAAPKSFIEPFRHLFCLSFRLSFIT